MAAADAMNHAVHFAGGRLRATLDEIGDTYTVELWAWNGMPNDARPVTGYLFSRGAERGEMAPGDHLGIGGTSVASGCLLFFNGNQANQVIAGKNALAPKTWNHVALVRDGEKVAIYLNGRAEPEAIGEATVTRTAGDPFFVGGRSDKFANFEGKIDEVAIYARRFTRGGNRGALCHLRRNAAGGKSLMVRDGQTCAAGLDGCTAKALQSECAAQRGTTISLDAVLSR